MSQPVPLGCIVEALSLKPDAEIVFRFGSDESRVTFAEFRSLVEGEVSLALKLGLTRGTVVGVVTENSFAAVVLDLALLQLGCVVVHMPEGSAKHLVEVIGANTEFLILARSFEHLAATDRYGACGSVSGMAAFRCLGPTEPDAQLDGVPAVIFSSGTTGRLKKMLVSAEGVIHHGRLFFEWLQPQADDSFLIFLPLSNYQQKLLIYGCILAGVNMCITDMPGALSALQSARPTLFLAPPIFYEAAARVARTMRAEVNGDARFSEAARALRAMFGGRMRAMWSGMAPISTAVLQAYAEAELPLREAYGMTECGPIAANSASANRTGSVGRPISAEGLQIAPDGEIIVRSDHPFTKGYWREPQEDEWSVYLGAGRVATGDIGHLDDEGYLWLRGRKKELIVTSGGHKLHPRSIEVLFEDLAQVRHAVLMGSGRPYLGILLVVSQVSPAIHEQLAARISQLNAGLCQMAPIRKWLLHEGELSVESGFLTRNLKLHRQRIAEHFETRLFA